jgi:hypothetical protein
VALLVAAAVAAGLFENCLKTIYTIMVSYGCVNQLQQKFPHQASLGGFCGTACRCSCCGCGLFENCLKTI